MTTNGNFPPEGNGESAPNPFDPDALRLNQTFAEKAGVKKLRTTVPVRRPNPQDFFRVCPDLSYRLSPAGIIELKEERETYLVAPTMAKELQGEYAAATLFTAITRQDVLFIWPVKLPGPDGKSNPWHQSAAKAVECATSCWIRMKSNMYLGAYETFEATGNYPDPDWSMLPPFQELLEIAFRGRIIGTPDHEVVRRLQGKS
jgi:hypothetical protein